MIDANGPFINIQKRTIEGIAEMREIVVKGDDLSQIITFTMADDFDGVDVLSKTIWIRYINADGVGDKCVAIDPKRLTLDKEIKVGDEVIFNVGDTVIQFGWQIDKKVTVNDGKVPFSIQIKGPDYSWSTTGSTLIVEDTVDPGESIVVPDQTWLDSYEQRLETMMHEAFGYKNTASVYAGNAAMSANQAKSYAQSAAQRCTFGTKINDDGSVTLLYGDIVTI